MTDFRETPGTPEEVATLIERLQIAHVGWCEEHHVVFPYEAISSVMLDAAKALASQRATIERLERENAQLTSIKELADALNAKTFSHVDGRDLLAQLHPRHELDIKRRVDGKETWFEGDWLSDVYRAIEPLRAALSPTTASATTGEVGRGQEVAKVGAHEYRLTLTERDGYHRVAGPSVPEELWQALDTTLENWLDLTTEQT